MEAKKEEIIYFYDKETEFVKKENIYLNNYAETPFKDEKGISWKTVENYYQAHKFDNFSDGEIFQKVFEEIHNSKNADESKKLARKYEKELKGKWQKNKWINKEYRIFIMKKALMFKFSQNINLLKNLESTEGWKLVERSEVDSFWGGLIDGSKNVLGNLLMELRENYLKTKQVFIEGTDLKPFNI